MAGVAMTYQAHDCSAYAMRTGIRCWDTSCLAWVTYCADCGADLTEHSPRCEL